MEPEQLFADTKTLFAGQPIGIVVAKTFEQAKKAAQLVDIKYNNLELAILNISDAIKANSFFPKPICGDLIKGDSLAAIENSMNKITGEILLDSSQFNFYLEV